MFDVIVQFSQVISQAFVNKRPGDFIGRNFDFRQPFYGDATVFLGEFVESFSMKTPNNESPTARMRASILKFFIMI